MASLHSGPFNVSKYHIPNCDVQGLKCLACLCAKATTQTTKTKSSPVTPTKSNVLKWAHLGSGHCILVDHYCPPKMGCLPHTFGRECIRYSCGTHFVDHACGFNFCQYSNNTTKAINSKCCLNLLLNKKASLSRKFTLIMVSLLPKSSKKTALHWVKYIPSMELGSIIRMALLNAI